MHTIRSAVESDAPVIAAQRCQMFQDNAFVCVSSWDELERHSEQWLKAHLLDGSYVGWLVERGGHVVGGAGLWFMEFPPHFMHTEPVRGYLLNFYVHPDARGSGIAKELVGLAVAECKRRGVGVAVLHASNMGRPVYESLGWQPSTEMMLRLNID
jgi:GNAT superfamily N-acetyltransferase